MITETTLTLRNGNQVFDVCILKRIVLEYYGELTGIALFNSDDSCQITVLYNVYYSLCSYAITSYFITKHESFKKGCYRVQFT